MVQLRLPKDTHVSGTGRNVRASRTMIVRRPYPGGGTRGVVVGRGVGSVMSPGPVPMPMPPPPPPAPLAEPPSPPVPPAPALGAALGDVVGSDDGAALGCATATTTPRVPPPGYGRLTIIVLDARTFRPVPDTCVSFGSLSCTTITAGDATALSYRTDDNGRWSLDVPLGAPTVSYDMVFFKLGYRVDIEKVTLRRGGSVVRTVFLLKTG